MLTRVFCSASTISGRRARSPWSRTLNSASASTSLPVWNPIAWKSRSSSSALPMPYPSETRATEDSVTALIRMTSFN